MVCALKINIQTGIKHCLRLLPHPLSVFAEKHERDFSAVCPAQSGRGLCAWMDVGIGVD